jgi:hypothetical protein
MGIVADQTPQKCRNAQNGEKPFGIIDRMKTNNRCEMRYTSRRGAGCGRVFDGADLEAELMKRFRAREECVVTCDGLWAGEVWRDPSDGKRGSWRWSYDPQFSEPNSNIKES